MPIEVEISLRIPNVKQRTLDEHGYPIDHAAVRFMKAAPVARVPKIGDGLQLPTASGIVIEAAVVRVEWHEDKELFIVACQYAKRAMPAEEHQALVTDPAWRMVPLI